MVNDFRKKFYFISNQEISFIISVKMNTNKIISNINRVAGK
jgi:hypothetical protein